MDRRPHSRTTTVHRRRGALLGGLLAVGTLTIVLLVFGSAAAAGPREVIWDPAATPSWWDGVAGAGGAQDSAADVTMTKGNAIFMAGTLVNASGNEDISLTKYGTNGRLWTRTWNGPAHDSDKPAKMAVSPDGKAVYIAGTSQNAAGKADIVVLKRSASNGKLLWARKYDGPAHGDDSAHAIGVDGRGNIVVAGTCAGKSGRDMVVVSWKASGAKRWVWRYDAKGHGDDEASAVHAAGAITYVTGMGEISGGRPAAITARLSKTGKKVWVKTYAGPAGLGGLATNMTPRPGGGVYICGAVLSASTGTDAMVVGYTARGSRKVFEIDSASGGATDEFFFDLAVATDKSVVAVGVGEAISVSHSHLVVYRQNGTIQTQVTVPGNWSDRFVAVATDAFYGWYVTGTRHPVSANDSMIITWRGSVLNAAGGWLSSWSTSSSDANVPAAIAVRGTNACVAGSYESGGATGVDQVLLMYNY